MNIYLKLKGADTYTLNGVGIIRYNGVIRVDADMAERLLEKGTLIGDQDNGNMFKPFFVQVSKDEYLRANAKPTRQTRNLSEAQIDALRAAEQPKSLGTEAPQAPEGNGPNGAETEEEGDGLDDAGKDEEDGEDKGEEDGEGKGEAGGEKKTEAATAVAKPRGTRSATVKK